MTQPPPANPPAPKPPATQDEALAAWQAEQTYQQFAGFMNRWLKETTEQQKPAPEKTEKPRAGGFLDSLFG